jgi:hypothetical protein
LGRMLNLRPMVSCLMIDYDGIFLLIGTRASIAYGHPSMIDVQDCDARLPSSGDLSDLYLDELVRLSIILGRVQKAIYT